MASMKTQSPVQTHGIELNVLLASLFEKQTTLPEGTAKEHVLKMSDPEKIALMEKLAHCKQNQLGATDITPADIRVYLRRTHEKTIQFRIKVPPKPNAAAAA
jgi:hypothetical protein